MRAPNPTYYKQDESGQWWYHPARGRPRTRAHDKVCEGCGEEYVVDAYHAARSRFCSRQCACRKVGMARYRGDQHPNWKGGRIVRKDGYVHIYAPDHPSVQGKRKQHVLEHRLVMEGMIGRLLRPDEEVPHMNGIKHDNRPENLELWMRSHPSGVRAADGHCPTCSCTSPLKITAAAS